MSRTDWKYLIDTLLFICLVGIALIGLFLGLVIPKGPAVAESSKYFLGLHRHQWGNIHFYLSLGFICLVVIHLILSWSWIKGKAHQMFKKAWPLVLVGTMVVAILVIVVFWLLYPRTPGAYEDYGKGVGRRVVKAEEDYLSRGERRVRESQPEVREVKSRSGEEIHSARKEEEKTVISSGDELSSHEVELEALQISGQITLAEIEQRLGVPAMKIVEKLGLPLDVPLNERLGRLRRRYLFSMQQVREVVLSLIKESKAGK
jgi:hypothetical protein